MAITPFEAASFYEYNRSKDRADVSFPMHFVVFYVDEYSVGFCTCTEDGQIETISSKEKFYGNSGCMENINEAFCRKTGGSNGICDCMGAEGITSFNKTMKRYYASGKDKNQNHSLKALLGIDLDCAGCEDIFRNALDRLAEWISLLDAWWPSQFDKSQSKFVIVGKAALFYPIEHCIRECLGSDPSLPDKRFAVSHSDRSDKIVSVGESEYAGKQQIDRMISICLMSVDRRGEEKKPIPLKHEESMTYWGPIFIAADEQLTFEINSQKHFEDISAFLKPSDSEVVEVGAYRKDDGCFIRIRKCSQPMQTYDIPIKI